METSSPQGADEARRRTEKLLRASPRSIQNANTCLLLAGAVMFARAIDVAWSRGSPLWTGVVAGSILAILAMRAGLAVFYKQVWVYWSVIVVSALVLLRSMIHAVAEIQRFVDGQSDRYFGFVLTLFLLLLSGGILRSLLKRESREYIRTPL